MSNNKRNRAGIAGLAVVISLAVCLTPVGRVKGNSGEPGRAASIQATPQIASRAPQGDDLPGTRSGRFHDLLPAMSNKDLLRDLSFGPATYSTLDNMGASVQSKGTGASATSPDTAFTFSNSTPITINDSGTPPTTASPYPSTILVSGLTHPVARVTVTLNNMSHTFPDDIDIVLVGPTGVALPLMSDAGGGAPGISGVTLTFEHRSISDLLPDNGPIVSGSFLPTNWDFGEPPDSFPGGPVGPFPANSLSFFEGTNGNGTWSLYVVDDASFDSGSIAGGWSLNIIDSVVTNTNDSGPGSLRQAILDSNVGGPSALTISFNIPGSGIHTIIPTSGLPSILFSVFIDGTTQPGFAGSPLIELRGTSAGVSPGLQIYSPCIVRGLVINGFNGDGILLGVHFDVPSTFAIIDGNYIGTNAAGDAFFPNSGNGITVLGSHYSIGGTTTSARNIISGNGGRGVSISGSGATSNRVQGNFIGTNASGTAALGNSDGVLITGASANIIGGTTPEARNIISGNFNFGVRIDGGAMGNLVQGNFIGTGVTGTAALANSNGGLVIINATNNTVGGLTGGARNVISGNGLSGVAVSGFGSNSVQGNFIGTDLTGTAPLSNSGAGVSITDAPNNVIGGTTAAARNIISSGSIGVLLSGLTATGNIVQGNFIGTDVSGTTALGNFTGVVIQSLASGNTIGGGVGAANTIAFNAGAGVNIGSTATGNTIFANSIFSNGQLGIDLGSDGVTPNDPLDADTGGNNLQNFPVLTSAISNSGNNTTTIIGSLDSTPSSTFTLQFFSNPSCDSSGNGEGKTYMGSATVTTTIDGNPASFIVALSPAVPVGQVVTATATNNSSRDTSEFSACRTVTSDSPTAVDDPEFAATAYDDGVLLHWQTGLEVNNLGFNVHRDEGGKVSLVNSQLIAGSALLVGSDVILGSGHSYQWWDNAPAGKSTTYWLEDRDINAQSRWHGPFHIDQIARGQLPPSVQQARTLASLSMTQGHSLPAEARAGLAAGSSAAGQSQSLIASSPNTVKLQVKHEAWYTVSAQELLNAGLAPSVDPRSLQLFVDGKQQAIAVTGQDDGRLDLDDTIEFYGIGFDSPFADLRTYYLIAGKQAGLRISNIQSPAHPAPGGSFEYAIERRDRTIYFAGLRNGDKENFFGAVLASQPVNQTLTLNHLAPLGASATLKVALQGVTNFSHLVGVRLNGADVGQIVFDGQSAGESSIAVSPAQLREGQNQVTLIVQGEPSDVSLVDYVQITYQHTFTADDATLKLGAGAGQQVTIDGFANDQIQVFDVTDPYAVQEVTGYVSRDASGVFSVSLIVGGKGQRSLLALSKDRAERVAKVVPDYPSTLRDPHQGTDLLIIARRELFESVGELKELRQKQGLSVAVADIENIYDEFSYGQKTPQAVKDFIGFANTQWKKPIRYVLFFGDASLDPKNYLGLGDFDFVPTRLIDTTFMETASDDWLADFDNDGIADLAIGRLPVRSVAEAQAMIDKLAAYEQSNAAEEALLVSDRNDGYNFEAANAVLKPLLPADVRALEVKRGQLGDQATKAAVIDGINRGQRIVNYAGHGNVNTWRGSVFNSTDALQLQNREHLAMFVMMNCLNGYFQDPALDSLAESLLKSPEGGAVAVWASSSMTFADGQAVMNPEFYRQVFSVRARLGEAAIRAKAVTFDGDVRRTWILLGDPTMRLK